MDLLFYSILLVYFTIIFFFHSPLEWYNDDSSYYMGTAQSIIKNHSLNFNFSPQTKFPPGYPLVLALLSLLLSNGTVDYELSVIGTGLIGLIGIAASYILLKKKSPLLAFTISTLLLTSPCFYSYSIRFVASDLPYFCVTVLTMLAGNGLESQHTKPWRIAYGIVFSSFLILTVLMRSIGITLLIAYVTYVMVPLIYGNRGKTWRLLKLYLAPFVMCLTCGAVWFLWSSTNRVVYYPNQYMDSYFSQIWLLNPHRPDLGLATPVDLLVRIFNFIVIQTTHLSEMLFHHEWFEPFILSPFVIIPIILLGVCIFDSISSKSIDVTLLYLFFYIAMLVIWPFDEGKRFIIPIFTIYCLNLFHGIVVLEKKLKGNSRKIVFFCLILALLGTISTGFFIYFENQKGLQYYCYFTFWVLMGITFGLISSVNFFYPALWNKTTISYFVKKNGKKILLYSCICLAACINLFGLFQEIIITNDLRTLKQDEIRLNNYAQAARWLKENVSKNAIISATQVAVPHLVSGMKVVPFPVTSSYNILIATVMRHKVDFLIIIDEGEFPYFYPTDVERLEMIKNVKKMSLSLIHSGKAYWIYKVENNAS